MEVSDEILADAVAAANEEFGCKSYETDINEARRVLLIRKEDSHNRTRWGVYVVAYVKAALKYSGKAP